MKILQIIEAAPGWHSEFIMDEGDYSHNRVITFVLVEDDEGKVGLSSYSGEWRDPGLLYDLGHQIENFRGHAFFGDKEPPGFEDFIRNLDCNER